MSTLKEALEKIKNTCMLDENACMTCPVGNICLLFPSDWNDQIIDEIVRFLEET